MGVSRSTVTTQTAAAAERQRTFTGTRLAGRGPGRPLQESGAVSASWLAGHVPFSRQAVSKHLVVLEQAGLISRRKQGREVLYHVEADRLGQATQAMADLAAQRDRRLGMIKRVAEAAHAEAKKQRSTEQEKRDSREG